MSNRPTHTNLPRCRPARRPGACLVRLSGGPEATHLLGRVFDVSADGCRLALPTSLRAGAALEVTQVGHADPAVLRAAVVDSTPLGGEWLHDCDFPEPLDEAQQRAWLPG